MFEIDENNLPFVRTRQALLVLDLQNEFLSPGCQLSVEEPVKLVDRILKILPEFRSTGHIIWVRSYFEASRPVNGPENNSEKVVTDAGIASTFQPGRPPRSSRPRLSEEVLQRFNKLAAEITEVEDDPEVPPAPKEQEDTSSIETFLTVPPGGTPCFVLPQSPATNIASSAAIGYDSDKDIIFQKSYYSAFRDGSLVQTLRSKFVTELYICGALTNISVFATAVDAAQFGYGITLVDDCLGYRSKARHNEALRRLTESTGCDFITSKELIQELREKLKATQRSAPVPALTSRRPKPQSSKHKDKKVSEPELDSMMAKLNLRPDGSPVPRSETISTGSSVTKVPPSLAVEESTGSSESILGGSQELPSPPRPPKQIAEAVQKPERVQTKIKSRRRVPKSATKDSEAVSGKLEGTAMSTSSMKNAHSEISLAPENVSKPSSELVVVDFAEVSSTKDSALAETSVMMHTSTTKKTTIDVLKDDKSVVSRPKPVVDKSQLPGDESPPICEGDTTIISDLLDKELADRIFEKIRDEVRWQKMSHQGGDVPRLVAVQGKISEDGSVPIYRHPSDESPPLLPFSPTVSVIRAEAEKRLGHPLNHVLIQFYRDGADHISEHSDKTLDIIPKTYIVNVSLGAQRTMIFRTKKSQTKIDPGEPSIQVDHRQSTRAPLPHNSMCKVGLVTNMRWLHGIRQDKRLSSEKSEAELAYSGARISLTFRQIGTFLSKDQQRIWGQGATSKSKPEAKPVINGSTPEAEKMIRAFGQENHSSDFDWAGSYGEGFDVLHMDNTPKLFLSGDKIADTSAKICLAAHNIQWAEGKLSPSFNWKDGSSKAEAPAVPNLPVKFVDNDPSKSTATGDMAILLYLDAVYGTGSKAQVDLAKQFTRLQQVGDLQKKWNLEPFSIKPFKRELELWNSFAKESEYMSGKDPSSADWLLWPILDEINAEWGLGEGLEALKSYHKRIRARDCLVEVLGLAAPAEKVVVPEQNQQQDEESE